MEITHLQNSISWLESTLYGFTQRLRMALLAYKSAPALYPVIKLDDGTKIDLSTNTITISGDFHIHSEGHMYLSSDKHVMINSNTKDGFHIHFNSELTDNKLPVYKEKKDV